MKKLVSFVLAVALQLTLFTTMAVAANHQSKITVEPGKIEKIEDDLNIKVIYPYLTGGSRVAKVNDEIRSKIISSIGYINDTLVSLKEFKEDQKKAGQEVSSAGVSLETLFDYNFSGDILSLVLNTYQYTGGAHGMSYLDSYTINTKTGEMLDFDSLFNKNSNYKKVILQNINKLIDKEKDLYFDDAKKTVAAKDSKYDFYIDGNKLVVYFGHYELRPYAGGMSFFEINAKELKGLLKNDIYSKMINAKPLQKVRFNGTSLAPQFMTYEKDYTLMVPLQNIAKLLGYKVTWNAEKGWGIAGGYVKNNVNSYYSDKAGKVKLELPPKAIGNIMYVPQDYFSLVLKEDVLYYGDALRIFNIDPDKQSSFDRLIVDFVYPKTPEQAVNLYAQAVQKRNGAVQYGLMSNTLRAANKAYFEELNWVTGVSSPWVTGYDIKKTGTGKYDVVFHWATSAGDAGDSTTQLTIAPINETEFYEITDLKEK